MASWTDFIGPVVGAVIGGTQGNRGGETTNTATKTLDPRLANYVFGQNGNGGLLADASSIYQQQIAQGGLNDMQRQGLDMQAQYLQSPQYTNSYQAMMNQGMGLLNAPIAGNPFTRSQGGQGGAPSGGGYQYRPSQVQAPIYRPAAPQTTLPMQIASPASQVGGLMGAPGQGNGTESLGGGSQLGVGRMTDAINKDALSTFNSYLGLGLAPAAAAALVGMSMATSQTLDAVNAADDPIGMLNAIQGWTDIGYSGGSGNPGFGDVGNSSFGEGEY